jgi:hypothetical protein
MLYMLVYFLHFQTDMVFLKTVVFVVVLKTIIFLSLANVNYSILL